MESAEEQEKYLREILDLSDPNHVRLIEEFRMKRQGSSKSSHLTNDGLKIYQKSARVEDFVPGKQSSDNSSRSLPVKAKVAILIDLKSKFKNSTEVETFTIKSFQHAFSWHFIIFVNGL